MSAISFSSEIYPTSLVSLLRTKWSIWWQKIRCLPKKKPRFRAEWEVSS